MSCAKTKYIISNGRVVELSNFRVACAWANNRDAYAGVSSTDIFDTEKEARVENLRRKIVIMEKRVYDHLDTLGKLKADYQKLLEESVI